MPTLLADVDPDSEIAQEEVFGPVLAVIAYDGDDEAVAIANNSIYGLSGEVSGADLDRAFAVATRMRTGNVTISPLSAGDNRNFLLAFGGQLANADIPAFTVQSGAASISPIRNGAGNTIQTVTPNVGAQAPTSIGFASTERCAVARSSSMRAAPTTVRPPPSSIVCAS